MCYSGSPLNFEEKETYMCGLTGYFAREAVDTKILPELFEEGAKRGTDGFGWCVADTKGDFNGFYMKKYIGSPDYHLVLDSVKQCFG